MTRRSKRLGLMGLVVAAGLVAAACGGGGGGGSQPSSSGGSSGGAASGKVELTAASGFSFNPKEIRAKVGQPLTIVLKNTDTQVHDFTVDGLKAKVDGQDKTGVQVVAQGGAEATLTFTPQQAGQYEFYCAVPGHKAAGMTGKLIVE